MDTLYDRLVPYASTQAAVLSTIGIFFFTNYIYNWLKFKIDYPAFINAKNKHNLDAPHLPAVVPWLGNAPAFLDKTPNKFWKDLFSWFSRSAGACHLTMGGQRTIVVFDPQAITALFKDRKLSRDNFDNQVVVNALGVSQRHADRMFKGGPGLDPSHPEEWAINLEYLMKADRVTEKTVQFIRAFQERINSGITTPTEVNINEWLRKKMFPAATEALMGRLIVDMIPELGEMFAQFDQDILGLFFGLPDFMLRPQITNRDRTIKAITEWQKEARKRCGDTIPDPETVAWEPIFGARHNRARQILYNKIGFDNTVRAALDLGNMFGFSSNTIPGAGWMLMRILDTKGTASPSLYDQILVQVRAARNDDGSLNVVSLMNQPVIMSCLHEVLRMDVDTLVSRSIPEDTTIPLADKSRSLRCKAGSILMVPSWPAHNNPEVWNQDGRPPANVFYPYRFLSHEPGRKEEPPVFNTSKYSGSYFPFGGGKAMCPGRLFARQEILTAVAILLLEFDFEVLHYVDEKGQRTTKFPGLRDTLPGSVVMVPSGDIKVRVTRRG